MDYTILRRLFFFFWIIKGLNLLLKIALSTHKWEAPKSMLYLLAKKPMACFTTYVLLLPINPSDAPCFDTPPTPCHRISPARVCYNISALLVYSVNCHRDLLS